MPNWCTTKLKVVGDDREIKQFLDGMTKDSEERYQILETYYPCPEPLRTTTAGWFSDEEKQAELVSQQAENIANYGHSDWYSWCVENWGTKWGDCDTQLVFYSVGEALFTLESAWSPITEGLEEVSKKFPNLYFGLEHIEEAGLYAGSEVIHNGETIAESFFSPSEDCFIEYPADGDADEVDDYYEAYGAWMDTEVRNARRRLQLELEIRGLHLNVFSETD